MNQGTEAVDLEAVARQHRRMGQWAEHVAATDIPAVLSLGAGVVLHGQLEAVHLGPVLEVIDPSVRTSLAQEHAALAADLQLLEELYESRPEGEDARELAIALLARMRQHLQRDDRVLYGPLIQLARAHS